MAFAVRNGHEMCARDGWRGRERKRSVHTHSHTRTHTLAHTHSRRMCEIETKPSAIVRTRKGCLRLFLRARHMAPARTPIRAECAKVGINGRDKIKFDLNLSRWLQKSTSFVLKFFPASLPIDFFKRGKVCHTANSNLIA